MSFEVSEPGADKKIDPIEIQNKTFSSSWRGYKVDEVRSFLAQVAFEIRELTNEIDNVRAKIAEIENRGQVTEVTLAAKVVKSEEIAAQILRDATEAAKALREQAEQFFDATRERAEAEAQMMIENATVRTRAMQLSDRDVSQGSQVADPTKRELELAREKSLEIIEQSKVEGRAMIDQARDLRNEILADLRHKRAILDTEIADLATRRIEAYQSLSRAVHLISEAASIVAVGDVQSEPASLSSEALVIEARHIDKSDEPLLTTAEKPRSPFVSSERSKMNFAGQNIEMGGHLEEGIVRVFTKDESEASPKSENSPTIHEAPDISEESEASVVGEAVDEESSDDIQLNSNDASYLRDDVKEDEESGKEPEESDQSDSYQSKNLDNETSSIDDFDVAHQLSDLEESVEESVASLGPHQFGHGQEVAEETLSDNSLVEIPAPQPAIERDFLDDGSHGDRVDDKAESSTRTPRSKRADDILARIRSLRSDEQLPQEQSKNDVDHHSGVSDESISDSRAPRSSMTSPDAIGSENERGHENSIGKDGDGGENLYIPPAEVDVATQELLEVREEILAPTATMLFRRAKRILVDEQNDLLDRVRRNSGSKVILEEILEEKVQIDSLAISSLDFFEQIRLRVAELFRKSSAASPHKEISSHAVEYSEEFAKELVLPLRRRVEEALAVDATLEDQATAGALGVIYRDVRSNRLEALISQYVNSVFCATVMRESGYDSFVWAIDPEDTPCADCLDNSLAGPTAMGEQFPTGHFHPAIHSGCRCLLVPFIA